ncbi:hypothetical protein BZL29_6896 [Mycobacterium kansasii]|uniref:Uncharacterized protein n=1 Tax=Mycobacterium kansasii TaxID=1768 RepID=A0A1V3WNC6_MYCKA|nr:hypothetical protein BZL29_6896 [Mycobacterium kansasii]
MLIIQEDPSGFRSLNDCTRIWRDGRVEQLGWPQVTIRYRSGTRTPTGAAISTALHDGTPVRFEIESKLAVPIHFGGGYGGSPDWLHGTWKGEKFAERRTYDMTDPQLAGGMMFGVMDHVGRPPAAPATRNRLRAGDFSSTPRWDATIRPASPTG